MLRHAISRRVGQGTSCELLDSEEIDECAEAARREINRMCPQYYFGDFNTQPSVQRYAAASVLPNNYLGSCEVFYSGGAAAGGCSNYVLFPGFGNQWDLLFSGAMSGLVGATVEYERIQQVVRTYSRLRKIFKPRGWLEKDGNIWLDPVPGGVTPVYFMVAVPRFPTVLSVDEVWAEPFFDFASSIACEILAGKQSEMASADDGGGKSARTAGGAVYLKLSEKMRERFYEYAAHPLKAGIVTGLSGF